MLFRIALTFAFTAVVLAGGADAHSRKRAKQDAPPAPVSPSDAPLHIDAGCSADLPKCCYTPCISYRERHCRKCCCVDTAHAVLKVADPCCCCYLEVPVCVPVCNEAPCVTSRCGLFGRGIVSYTWSCGYRIDMVITKHGDVRVTTFGA
jgi:hypothetical protein